ncbi:MAG: aminotransferase class V-fold PLP-dependent enzyme [Planctomycetota bacterium]|nr:aminotransferase class V-fold PLP-dependent enzyme [Planctomycetota bacterium]
MSSNNDNVTRRTVLKTGAGGALGTMLTRETSMASETTTPPPDVYQSLGIRPIINAAGTITALGGSLMPPEVVAAWTAAARSFVSLTELQDRVGEKIAERLGVEAALVTTGAAGGIVVGTAAALTHRDRSFVERLPLPAEMDLQVVRQASHRECYDNQVKACGVRLVDVETREDLERAINQRTVMMFSYNVHEGESKIPQREWVEVARRNNIPTLLDAAADAPPLDALSKYNRIGYDMVVFSGGKAIRGPQDAGLLLGRKDLIEAAKLNTAPRCGNIGRGMKVSKEDMVAMWAAIERFVSLDHEAEQREWERRIATIENALASIPTVETKRIVPPIANHVPHLLILWDEQRVRVTPAQVKDQLADGDPSIVTARVHGTGDKGFLVSVFMLQPNEDTIVAARLRQILEQAFS